MAVSFEQFMRKIYIQDAGELVEPKKLSRFSTGLDISKETGWLKSIVNQDDARKTLLSAVTDLHEGKDVEIYNIQKDPEKSERAFILGVRTRKDAESGQVSSENQPDVRVLLSNTQDGQDRLNDAGYSAIAREVGIPTYNMRVVLHPLVRTDKKVA